MLPQRNFQPRENNIFLQISLKNLYFATYKTYC